MPRKGERTWSDEQLRDAVRSSKSWFEVMRAIGLYAGGRNFDLVKMHAERLALDTRHFRRGARTSAYDDQLRALVPHVTSIRDLLARLGLTEADAARIRKRAQMIGLSTAHFVRTDQASSNRPRRWTDDQLRTAVATSRGLSPALRMLGLVPAGGNYVAIQRRIRELAIDTSHFSGKSWSKGTRHRRSPPRPLSEVLVAGRWTASHKLKRRLFREGLKHERCERCGWAEQRPIDGVIPLELDHANGDHSDNRLENLRVLCPNCHALQATHRGLNQRRRER